MTTEFGVCNLSQAPLRAEASDKSEIRSFLLFGDCFKILESTSKWTQVQTLSDDYTGWMDPKQFEYVPYSFVEAQGSSVITGPVLVQTIERIPQGDFIHLPSGCTLPLITDNKFSINSTSYRFTKPPILADSDAFYENIKPYAYLFLNAPYLWGGKSAFGIDCSGFTQIVFKMLGITLPRDAWQQAEEGNIVNFLQEVKPGDLAFFDNEEGRIIHVGILLNEQEIIHASGRVKIDLIDGQGIFNKDLNRHTHRLRIIKRFFN
ncbi:lipoprotein [Arcticibacter svalbardensis MN12-7]|uniref:Lipoprotein n=1 Tax=Arcticibacter svalbardensis MN12-7 TaxID=1150600 RepID=R9GXU3_9SPHI|nr:C40 family peptidase [Arcticibacter svalbardensis]EOR93784.1 lipoprotein [Arcticibacter svalbardensis MN12-7]